MIAMGGGPQLPPPRLAGVTDAPAPSIATYTPQITGLGPQGSVAAGPTGAPYVAQPTGGYVPQVRDTASTEWTTEEQSMRQTSTSALLTTM